MEITITNCYNNIAPKRSKFKTGLGNSFWIQTPDDIILFDTGWNGKKFVHNLAALNLSAADVGQLVFSHGHMDHTGGLKAFLQRRRALGITTPIKITAHPSINEVRRVVRLKIPILNISMSPLPPELSALVEWNYQTDAVEILPNIWFSGEITDRSEFYRLEASLLHRENDAYSLDPIRDDTSLFFKAEDGIVILSGCGHAGLLNICAKAVAMFPGISIKAIIGGAHMAAYSQEDIAKVLTVLREKYNTPELYLNHCTGAKTGKKIADLYPKGHSHDFFVGNTYSCRI